MSEENDEKVEKRPRRRKGEGEGQHAAPEPWADPLNTGAFAPPDVPEEE